METILRLFKAVLRNLIAVIVISLLIAAAPLISIAALIAPFFNYNDYAAPCVCWFASACPFCVGIYYMFIATMTRYSRSKIEKVTPRDSFMWSGARMFGGWILSYGLVVGLLVISEAFKEAGYHMSDLHLNRQAYLLAVQLTLGLLAWSPVLINLTRHFMRHARVQKPTVVITVPLTA